MSTRHKEHHRFLNNKDTRCIYKKDAYKLMGIVISCLDREFEHLKYNNREQEIEEVYIEIHNEKGHEEPIGGFSISWDPKRGHWCGTNTAVDTFG